LREPLVFVKTALPSFSNWFDELPALNLMKIYRQKLIFAIGALSLYSIVCGLSQPPSTPTPEPGLSPAIPQVETPNSSPQVSPNATPPGNQANPAVPGPSPEMPLPEGKPGEAPAVQPLIPPSTGPGAVSPTPTPKSPITPEAEAEFDQRFEEALTIPQVSPPALAPIVLLDAVRIALSKNPNLRLSAEDSQSARGQLKEATGKYDTEFRAITSYAVEQPAAGSNSALNNTQTILNNALQNIFRNLGLNVSNLISRSVTQAVQNQTISASQNVNTLVSLSKKLRNGVSLELSYEPVWTNQSGNIEYPPTAHRIVLTMTLPIGKKGGTLYNNTKEITARIDYQASLFTLRNAAQKAVLTTVQDYWKTVAALRKFALAERTLRVSNILLDLSNQLAKGDAIPYSEVTLAQAKQREAFAQRLQALVAIYDAAKSLAITMGLTSDEVHKLPLGIQVLPGVTVERLNALDTDQLVDAALARRLDRAAALETIKSKNVDLEKAKRDLIIAPEVFTSIGGVINNEATQNNSGQTVRGTKLGGDVAIAATLAWPFANNTAEGGVIDAQAKVNQAIINMETLSTTIAVNIFANLDSLRDLAKQVESEREAAGAYRKYFDDMREKFRKGATTMLETIQSEERLTGTDLALVDTRLALALALAQLRFETGTLLSDDTSIRVPAFPNGLEQTTLTERSLVTLPDLRKPVGPALNDRNYEPNIKYISGHPPWHH
jgi:outer membrane protein TolC